MVRLFRMFVLPVLSSTISEDTLSLNPRTLSTKPLSTKASPTLGFGAASGRRDKLGTISLSCEVNGNRWQTLKVKLGSVSVSCEVNWANFIPQLSRACPSPDFPLAYPSLVVSHA
jgi:hypothetical protein